MKFERSKKEQKLANRMESGELEDVLALCYDEIMVRIGDICIARAGKTYDLVSTVNAHCIISEFHIYNTINNQYISIVKMDRKKRKHIMQVIYSIKQNKIWDIPKQPQIEQCNGKTLFIGGRFDTNYDIAVFNNKTGKLIDRIKVLRPTDECRTTAVKSRISKYKVLEFRISYTRQWKGYYKYEARVLFRPEFKIGRFKIGLAGDNNQ